MFPFGAITHIVLKSLIEFNTWTLNPTVLRWQITVNYVYNKGDCFRRKLCQNKKK